MAALCMAVLPALNAYSQDAKKQEKPTDSIKKLTKIVETDSKEEKNRNVMLNAANNTGPRDVNIAFNRWGNYHSGK